MTNQALSLYDGLPKPEEQIKIDVNASPVDIVRSTYTVWSALAKKVAFNDICHNTSDMNTLYNEAANLVKPYSSTFKDINPGSLESVISELGTEVKSSGLYFSALLNETELKAMTGVFKHQEYIGHKLQPEKILIIKGGSDLTNIGTRMEGGFLINYGKCLSFASFPEDGLAINFGESLTMAGTAYGGIQLNYGNNINKFIHRRSTNLETDSNDGFDVQSTLMLISSIGSFAMGGVQINMNRADYLGERADNGLQLNYNLVNDFGIKAIGGIEINAGYVRKWENKIDNAINIGYVEDMKLNGEGVDLTGESEELTGNVIDISPFTDLVSDLKTRLKSVKRFQKNTPDVIDKVLLYNWQGFESDINNLTTQIKDMVK